ncbi:hypothetical protein FF38_01306 [Lucilia cuprina]|uniref:Uncharacterized protein n=1 Tax=Lucilia cuprina TaxID=7375 RepID=A0A0L0BUT0_LUCCU|nr:hypothetical protein FF38_01306 [Lucilia cuprina]
MKSCYIYEEETDNYKTDNTVIRKIRWTVQGHSKVNSKPDDIGAIVRKLRDITAAFLGVDLSSGFMLFNELPFLVVIAIPGRGPEGDTGHKIAVPIIYLTKRPRPAEDSDTDREGNPDSTFIKKPNHNNSIAASMDVDQANIHEQSGSSRGPNTGARSSGSGITPASNVTWIRPSTPCANNYMHFSNLNTADKISYLNPI